MFLLFFYFFFFRVTLCSAQCMNQVQPRTWSKACSFLWSSSDTDQVKFRKLIITILMSPLWCHSALVSRLVTTTARYWLHPLIPLCLCPLSNMLMVQQGVRLNLRLQTEGSVWAGLLTLTLLYWRWKVKFRKRAHWGTIKLMFQQIRRMKIFCQELSQEITF